MTTTDEAAARIEATIHLINNHWWNGRRRPEAPDLRALLDERDRLLASQERAIAEAVERGFELAKKMAAGQVLTVCYGEDWSPVKIVHAIHSLRNLKGTEHG